jgi:hypothetical protein
MRLPHLWAVKSGTFSGERIMKSASEFRVLADECMEGEDCHV